MNLASSHKILKEEEVNLQIRSKNKWILYSTSDEDSNSEVRALNISASDTVLCVTGSGCRTLSLLTCNPQHLISIDCSPGQNYLLELKLVAFRNLSYDTLLQLFGVDEHQNRWDIFCLLKDQMSPQAVSYFQAHRWAIERGILFAGRHELFYVRFVAPLIRVLFGCHFDRIFQASTLEVQRSIYQKHVAGPLWHLLIRFGFSPLVLRFVLNDSSYFVEMHVPVAQYLLERLEHTFSHHLAKNNHWTSLMFYGKYLGRDCLPHFLLEENYHAIRKATTNVKIVTTNLLEYVNQMPDRSIDKYSLSDVSSCLSQEKFESLLADVARTTKDKGRVCYRNFLAKRGIPPKLQEIMQRDDALCSSLDWDDLSFVYNFEVATIKQSTMCVGAT